VVVVNSQGMKYLNPELLRWWGFVPAGWGGADMGIYTLWSKGQSGVADNGSPRS
jgi:hypothetical protein